MFRVVVLMTEKEPDTIVCYFLLYARYGKEAPRRDAQVCPDSVALRESARGVLENVRRD
jgi:hypothetical protein